MNADPLFMDTSYLIALISERDQLHRRAVALSAGLRRPLITTDAVLLEVGNGLARPPMRRAAVALFARLRANPSVEIVPLTTGLLERAIAFYADRPDKDWGLVDCVSFVVMEDRGIREALAADQDFVQAGFRALLRQ